MDNAAPSFLDATPTETAEFEAVRDEKPVQTPAAVPEPAKAIEPPATPEPAKAVEPPKAPDAPKVDERPKFVPHAALHEERLRRQALEKELADLRAGKTQEPPQAIDPETDPIGALKEIRAFQQEQRQQGERQQQESAFMARVQTHEQDFAAATPDYGAAITHLRETRAAEIVATAKALGQPLSQEQLGAQLRHEALMTANVAFQSGKNPGEVFYELAKTKGYMLKAPEPAPKIVEPAKQAAETIERITRGQKAAKVSGGGDPPSAGGEMTLESLAQLEGAAFDAAFDKFSKAQRNVH